METLLRDLRHRFRMLLKNPALTLVIVLTLALGIGANIAMFSMVNTVLLQSLPFKDSERLVSIWTTSKLGERSNTAYPLKAHCEINDNWFRSLGFVAVPK